MVRQLAESDVLERCGAADVRRVVELIRSSDCEVSLAKLHDVSTTPGNVVDIRRFGDVVEPSSEWMALAVGRDHRA